MQFPQSTSALAGRAISLGATNDYREVSDAAVMTGGLEEFANVEKVSTGRNEQRKARTVPVGPSRPDRNRARMIKEHFAAHAVSPTFCVLWSTRAASDAVKATASKLSRQSQAYTPDQVWKGRGRDTLSTRPRNEFAEIRDAHDHGEFADVPDLHDAMIQKSCERRML